MNFKIPLAHFAKSAMCLVFLTAGWTECGCTEGDINHPTFLPDGSPTVMLPPTAEGASNQYSLTMPNGCIMVLGVHADTRNVDDSFYKGTFKRLYVVACVFDPSACKYTYYSGAVDSAHYYDYIAQQFRDTAMWAALEN